MSDNVGLVFAKVPFRYGDDLLDRGQIVKLKGYPKDDKLIGLSYLRILDLKSTRIYTCDDCGRKFAGEMFKTMHKQKPNCNADQSETKPINKLETAEMLNVEPDKLVMNVDVDRDGHSKYESSDY